MMKNINIEFKAVFLWIIAFFLLITATYYYNVSSKSDTNTISDDIKKEEIKPREYYLDLGGGHYPKAQKVTRNEIYRWVKNMGPRTGFGNTSYRIEERQTEDGLYYVRLYSEDQFFLQKIHTVFNLDVQYFKRNMQRKSQGVFNEKQKTLEH